MNAATTGLPFEADDLFSQISVDSRSPSIVSLDSHYFTMTPPSPANLSKVEEAFGPFWRDYLRNVNR